MIDLQKIPKLSGIYKFTNKINNKVYIGQAVNLYKRILGHTNNSRLNKKNKHFYNSIQKYGLENFEVEILKEGKFTKQELDQMEITYIRLFNSMNQKLGYNLTEGGKGNSGYKPSLETRKKQSEKKKGLKRKLETVEKMKNTKKLNPFKHSEESKQKMSKVQKSVNRKGKKASQETKKKMSESQKGRKHTEESKLLMKFKQKNKKPITEEIKKKISETLKGHKLKLESIEKRTRSLKFNKAIKYFQKNNWIYEWII